MKLWTFRDQVSLSGHAPLMLCPIVVWADFIIGRQSRLYHFQPVEITTDAQSLRGSE